jgi:hypothetical protein
VLLAWGCTRHPASIFLGNIMIIKTLLIASLTTLVVPATLTVPESEFTKKYKLLKNVQSGKCLDVAHAGTADRTRVIQFDCDRQKAHQRFWFRPDGKNDAGVQLWNIIPLHAEACLDVAGANTSNGTPIILYHCTGGANQKFIRYPDGGIQSFLSGRCLDIEGAVMHNGGKLHQWGCHGGANQLFKQE